MMLLRHHEKTKELEYRQQKAVHALREEQVTKPIKVDFFNRDLVASR